jgi:hypothetical protein
MEFVRLTVKVLEKLMFFSLESSYFISHGMVVENSDNMGTVSVFEILEFILC